MCDDVLYLEDLTPLTFDNIFMLIVGQQHAMCMQSKNPKHYWEKDFCKLKHACYVLS